MGRHRILIIEDEPEIVALVTLTAEAVGVESFAVGSVDQIADALASFKPTVLLVDLSIFGGVGHDVLRPLVDSGATVPMIIMSGSGVSEHVEEDSRRMGLNPIGRLDKPFRRAELRAAIEKLCQAAGSPPA